MSMLRHTYRAARFAFVALALFLLLPASEARAAWRAAGDVKAVERQTDGVILTLTSGARVAVTFRDLETVRVRFAPSGTFERDLSYAVESRDRKTVKASISVADEEIRVSSLDGTNVLIRRRPFLVSVFDAAGLPVAEADPLKSTPSTPRRAPSRPP